MEEESELIALRRQKLDALRTRGVAPFGQSFETSGSIADVRDKFEEAKTFRVAGRITAHRDMGKSHFLDLRDASGRIQIYVQAKELGPEAMEVFALLDLGDFIGVEGSCFVTKTGEPTLKVHKFEVLAKSLRPLPEKWHGLTDVEARLRERYLDLIVNETVRDTFRIRALVVGTMRRLLDERGFIEVETPVLQPIYGGATARPFTTHHNQLHQKLYLRIAKELYLKRLIVGGFERVYEIGRDFRNEGVDRTHNPEFTMMECYQAYADYSDMMALVEELCRAIALAVTGTTSISYRDQLIDFAPAWQRVSIPEAISERTGIDIMQITELIPLQEAIRAAGLRVDTQPTWGKQVDELFSTYVQPLLIQPTFVLDHPVPLSPLAKRRPDQPLLAERFEPIIAGMELGNAFTELNDPLDQEQRFLEQGRDYNAGDDEAQQMDRDFINALMYGMPPTGGLGIGIDRLVMLFANQETIREVILFPHLRQRD
jgi:lysyl-tRNA synthetase class 2